jgi:hypothetical protein
VPLPGGTRQPRQYSLSRADQGDSCQLDIPPRDIQYEVFGPDLWQADYE